MWVVPIKGYFSFFVFLVSKGHSFWFICTNANVSEFLYHSGGIFRLLYDMLIVKGNPLLLHCNEMSVTLQQFLFCCCNFLLWILCWMKPRDKPVSYYPKDWRILSPHSQYSLNSFQRSRLTLPHEKLPGKSTQWGRSRKLVGASDKSWLNTSTTHYPNQPAVRNPITGYNFKALSCTPTCLDLPIFPFCLETLWWHLMLLLKCVSYLCW